MSDLEELFRSEGAQYLQLLNDNLLQLERAEDEEAARECLDEMFRAAHSLKGMAGTMGYRTLANLTHRMEDLFDSLRRGQLQMTPPIADLLFEALDVLEVLINRPEEDIVPEDMLQRFQAALQGQPFDLPTGAAGAGAAGTQPGAQGGPSGTAATAGAGGDLAEGLVIDSDQMGSVYRAMVSMAAAAPMKSVRAHVVLRALEEKAVALRWRPDPENDPDEAFDNGFEVIFRTDLPPEEVAQHLENVPDVIGVQWAPLSPGGSADGGKVAAGTVTAATSGQPAGGQVSAGATAASPAAGPVSGAGVAAEGAADDETESGAAATFGSGRAAAGAGSAASGARTGDGAAASRAARGASSPSLAPDRIVRVDTEQLDKLLNLVGELVIHRIRLREVSAEERQRNTALAETMEQIDRITDSMQDAVMALRMVPVGQVFARFPRVVRDIARKFNKRIELITEGEDTELDRSIVHRLGDPLVHLIRNSADHGIEQPEERQRLGKPPVGRLRLAARHEGNHVIIEVEDDGRGIDPERIARVAVQRGVLTQDEADALTPAQKLELIFRPGFSTAEQVTDVSGRGVGMDAVRTAIESFNGQVEIASEVGKGTRVTLRLPLTLAIIPALLVRCLSEIYALPLGYVVQNLRLRPEEIRTIQGFPHVVWQGQILPLRQLSQLMGLRASHAAGNGAANGAADNHAAAHEHGAADNHGMQAVVIDTGGRRSALHVDEILGQQEIVIKNISSVVGDVRGVAGATILGSGRVALIVDLPSLV